MAVELQPLAVAEREFIAPAPVRDAEGYSRFPRGSPARRRHAGAPGSAST